jgi:hypothetical protein
VTKAQGEEVAELDAPASKRLPRHDNAAFQQQFFDVPIAEREAVVQPHDVADHGERNTVARGLLTVQHGLTLPQQLATTS